LQSAAPFDAIRVQGWIRTRRDSKDFSFIELMTARPLRNLQIIAKKDALPITQTSNGSTAVLHLLLRARWSRRRAKGKWELVARDIQIVGGRRRKLSAPEKGTRRNFCARSRTASTVESLRLRVPCA